MAAEGTIGVDVIIQISDTAILGQRNAQLTYPAEMVDMTTKADWPHKRQRKGWRGPWSISCDGLLMAGGTGGVASLINMVKDDTLYPVTVVFGDSGEEATGTGYISNLQSSGPETGEATYSCDISGDDELVATVGS